MNKDMKQTEYPSKMITLPNGAEVEPFDPSSLDRDHPLRRALRATESWFAVYSKALCLKWAWSGAVPFAATDGEWLLFNRKGVEMLEDMSPGCLPSLIAHECLHALLNHPWRLTAYPPEMANIAADYVINAMIALRQKHDTKRRFPPIPGWLNDPAMVGSKSVEELLHELLGKQKKQQPKPGAGVPDKAGGSAPAPTPPPPQGVPCRADPVPAAPPPPTIPGSGAPDVLPGSPEPEAVAKAEQENERITLQAEAHDRAEADAASGSGTSRLRGLRRTVSPLDWKELLEDFVVMSLRNWTKPFNAPIYGSTGTVCCGMGSPETGGVALVLDSSGSIPDQLWGEFLGQAQNLLDGLHPEWMALLSVSHEVMEAVELESGDTVPTSMNGGGGTRFAPAFAWVAGKQLEPAVLAYLTDGLASDLDRLKDPGYPVLWIVYRNPGFRPPFGDTVHIHI